MNEGHIKAFLYGMTIGIFYAGFVVPWLIP